MQVDELEEALERGRKVPVLLVDDVADTRKIFGRLLEKMGNQVCTAPDGPSALEAARAFLPDVVLLDIGLPTMDGYQLGSELRKRLVRALRVLARDALAAKRRRMPWLPVDKEYEFEGPEGDATLLDLFDDRRVRPEASRDTAPRQR